MNPTDNDRDGMDVARDEFEHNEAIRDACEMAGETLRALMATTNWRMLTKNLIAFRGTLELMTGETWPAQLPAFLAKCDLIVRGDEDVAA